MIRTIWFGALGSFWAACLPTSPYDAIEPLPGEQTIVFLVDQRDAIARPAGPPVELSLGETTSLFAYTSTFSVSELGLDPSKAHRHAAGFYETLGINRAYEWTERGWSQGEHAPLRLDPLGPTYCVNVKGQCYPELLCAPCEPDVTPVAPASPEPPSFGPCGEEPRPATSTHAVDADHLRGLLDHDEPVGLSGEYELNGSVETVEATLVGTGTGAAIRGNLILAGGTLIGIDVHGTVTVTTTGALWDVRIVSVDRSIEVERGTQLIGRCLRLEGGDGETGRDLLVRPGAYAELERVTLGEGTRGILANQSTLVVRQLQIPMKPAPALVSEGAVRVELEDVDVVAAPSRDPIQIRNAEEVQLSRVSVVGGGYGLSLEGVDCEVRDVRVAAPFVGGIVMACQESLLERAEVTGARAGILFEGGNQRALDVVIEGPWVEPAELPPKPMGFFHPSGIFISEGHVDLTHARIEKSHGYGVLALSYTSLFGRRVSILGTMAESQEGCSLALGCPGVGFQPGADTALILNDFTVADSEATDVAVTDATVRLSNGVIDEKLLVVGDFPLRVLVDLLRNVKVGALEIQSPTP